MLRVGDLVVDDGAIRALRQLVRAVVGARGVIDRDQRIAPALDQNGGNAMNPSRPQDLLDAGLERVRLREERAGQRRTGAVDSAGPQTAQAGGAIDIGVRSHCRRRDRNLVAVRPVRGLVVDDFDRSGGWNAVAVAEDLRQPVCVNSCRTDGHQRSSGL